MTGMQLFYNVKKCQLPRLDGLYGEIGDFPPLTISRKIKPILIRGADYAIGLSPLDLNMFSYGKFPRIIETVVEKFVP